MCSVLIYQGQAYIQYGLMTQMHCCWFVVFNKQDAYTTKCKLKKKTTSMNKESG